MKTRVVEPAFNHCVFCLYKIKRPGLRPQPLMGDGIISMALMGGLFIEKIKETRVSKNNCQVPGWKYPGALFEQYPQGNPVEPVLVDQGGGRPMPRTWSTARWLRQKIVAAFQTLSMIGAISKRKHRQCVTTLRVSMAKKPRGISSGIHLSAIPIKLLRAPSLGGQ